MWTVLVEKVGLILTPEHVQDLGWTPDDWKYRFNPGHLKDISDSAQNTQRSHYATEKCSVNEVQIGEYTTRPFNAVEYVRHYDTLSWMKS